MIHRDSRSEYESRMHRVLQYIDDHLDEPLDLMSLASVAHFSSFHFHRLFAAWMGETLGDYLRRRRLEVAAMRLMAQPRTKILNMALSVGFGSSEAFARAFKSRFGCSPTAWRERQSMQDAVKSNFDQVNRKGGQVSQALCAEHEDLLNLNQKFTMKVVLIDRPAATVAYFRHLGPYGEAIERFWQDIYVPWAMSYCRGQVTILCQPCQIYQCSTEVSIFSSEHCIAYIADSLCTQRKQSAQFSGARAHRCASQGCILVGDLGGGIMVESWGEFDVLHHTGHRCIHERPVSKVQSIS